MKRLYTLATALLVCAVAQAAQYSGTLPVMYINTADNAPIVTKEKYLDATYYIDNLGLADYQSVGSADNPLPLQIKGRGNYSWSGFDKKPYRLKLVDKQPLLGLAANKHFVLLAHADDSYGFLRNTMGFYISRTIGMPWTPEQRPVEVVLNGDYIGLYFLTENIRVDKDRVNIDKQADNAVDPEEITGGWLVEIDNYDSDPHITITEGDGSRLIVTYKAPEELSPEQEQYLTDQISTINTEVYSSNTTDCAWAQHVDLATLAKFYIVQEIMDNYESFHGSCYLYKQRGDDQKWMWGPVWDFGSAFNYVKKEYIYQGREHHQTWIGQMCKFPQFMAVVKSIWQDYYANHYLDMIDYVQQFADEITPAAIADAKRWPKYGNADEQAKALIVQRRLQSSCTWLLSQWGSESVDPATKPVTVYYINNSDNPWNPAYAYSWDNNGDGEYLLFGNWPGSQMTPTIVNGESGYVITATPTRPLSDRAGLIFGNGGSGNGNQTADLILVNGDVYRQDGSHRPVNSIASVAVDNAPVAYYSLDGRRIANPAPGAIVIARTANGAKVVKVER